LLFANAIHSAKRYWKSTGQKFHATMMSRRSQHEGFFPMASDQSMSSVEAFRAKTSALRARARASTAGVQDYGRNLPVSLAKYDLVTQSWKTFQHSLFGDLIAFSETWPRSGMMQNGIAYRLRPLVRLTDATECGLLPTPDASSGN
jgi:hypothetical protein